ncbi:hypothetical protein HRbin21_01495 [bacterium HR21]|nr:hypothetical protein HRbin21_01495 [bacterium HR21]
MTRYAGLFWTVMLGATLWAQQTQQSGRPEIRGMEPGAAAGYWQQADPRTKAELRPLPYGLREVLRLKPWAFRELPAWWEPSGELRLGNGGAPSIGLLGEEVKAVIPEAARRPLSPVFNFWEVDYTKLVPVLVRAIQEQQAQLEERERHLEGLRRELEELRDEVRQLRAQILAQQPAKGSDAERVVPVTPEWLGQNIPNPFEGTTTIPYYVPAGVSRAELVVRDLGGRELRRVELSERGAHGQVTLEMRLLGSGTYEYALVLDGRVVATRQMTLVK